MKVEGNERKKTGRRAAHVVLAQDVFVATAACARSSPVIPARRPPPTAISEPESKLRASGSCPTPRGASEAASQCDPLTEPTRSKAARDERGLDA